VPKRRTLDLSEQQRKELLDCRDHHKQAYMRERAAALLFIADGLAPAVVARKKLWRSRDPDTIYTWLDRYQQDGLGGLLISQGRGRKPAFSPSLPERRKSQRGPDPFGDTPQGINPRSFCHPYVGGCRRHGA
jgi:hypothetical protein